jgi:L-asparaginase II
MIRLTPGVPLVEVVRSGVVEGLHSGHVVVIDSHGRPIRELGDVRSPIFPRSANKPMQAVALLRTGLQLSDDQLALAAASHSGEPKHVTVVRSILADGGISAAELGCVPDLPLNAAAAAAVIRAGGGPEPILMNCSGKHAAMLSSCRLNGWSRPDYLDSDHPLQQVMVETIADLGGAPVEATGVDGCGAPLFSVSLLHLAQSYLGLVDGPDTRVADAIRGRPDLVAGTGRTATRLMTDIAGLLAKDGAEGVWAAALPGLGAVAVKIDDGAMRAADRVVVAALGMLGIRAGVLDELAELPLPGGRHTVGAVRIRPDLR